MSPFLPYFLDMSLQFFSNLFVFLSHVTLLHEAEAWFLLVDIMGHVGWIPVGVSHGGLKHTLSLAASMQRPPCSLEAGLPLNCHVGHS